MMDMNPSNERDLTENSSWRIRFSEINFCRALLERTYSIDKLRQNVPGVDEACNAKLHDGYTSAGVGS
jgi:hypothetical protein